MAGPSGCNWRNGGKMEFKHESNRIYLDGENGLLAEIAFPKTGDDVVCIDHTFVDASLRGQGVAAALCEAAYEQIKSEGRKFTLLCPYAIKWFNEHPEKNDIVIQ
jgi:predicted GNAT family acetyltransferase